MFYVYVLRRLEISVFVGRTHMYKWIFQLWWLSAMMGTLSTKLDHMLQNSVFEQKKIHGVYISSQCIRETNEFMDEVYS